MRAILAAMLSLAAVLPAAAKSVPGRCLIEVGGKRYLDEPCNIDLGPDGSFSVGTGDGGRASRYFAYVSLDGDGTATGSWNGIHAASHAHDSLGTLTRQGGACWANARARICAWR